MKIFKKLLKKIKISKVHDGKPYSFEELMDMSDEGLGVLYHKYGNGYSSDAIDDSMSKINKIKSTGSVIIGVLAGVMTSMSFSIYVNNNVTIASGVKTNLKESIVASLPEDLLLLMFTIIGVSAIVGLIIFGVSYLIFYLWGEKKKTKIGLRAFDDVKRNNLDLSNLKNALSSNTSGRSRAFAFLKNADKAIWMDHEHVSGESCTIDDYSDEELGRLLKILLPVMKLDHDGGILNSKTFKTLDEELDLSGRMERFDEEVIPMALDRIKVKQAKKEKEASDRSFKIAESLADDVMQVDHSNTVMDGQDNDSNRMTDMKRRLKEHMAGMNAGLSVQED